jgi:hypothetical protein
MAILLLCLLAAIHVFIYAAAFPFFNNVDEPAHFDLVLKYARGDIPRRLETYSDGFIKFPSLYGAPVYLSPATNSQEFVPQPWKLAPAAREILIRANQPWLSLTNLECSQPPLYYTMAAGWWRLGGQLGLGDGQKLYSLHFLNIPIVCLLVWLGWFTARQVFPDRIFPRIAVPAFITFMPQSAFYSIQSDVLSPLCFGIAFVCLLRLFETEKPGWQLGVFIGLALAATFLTKMTNVPLLAVAIVALAWFAWRRGRDGKLRPALPALSVLTACAALPALAWMGWCRANFGDLTGSKPKAMHLGWTPKPFPEWFHHPIFTFHGAWLFSSRFIPEFWQGEITWFKQPLCLTDANWLYEFATVALFLVALAGIIRRPAPARQTEYRALRFSFFLFAAVIAFLIYLSIRFDFHDCLYPSRQYPYLASGRLALGALIPFMLLFVSGLDRILNRLSLPLKFLILAAFNLTMLITELAANKPAFFDQYNWYHM